MSKPTLIYFGSSSQSARLLTDILKKESWEIAAVITRPEPRQGHRSQTDTPVAKIANDAGIRLLRPQNTDEIIPEIKSLNVQAGLLFAYGKILSDELIKAFSKGIINVHPSLLPLHRGPSPIEATILAGDSQAGTSIMLIEKDMDAGPILQQVSFPIDSNIDKDELWERLYTASLQALEECLPRYLNGEIKPRPQLSTGATYCKLLRKSDGLLELHQETAHSVERKVRAYADWPRVRIKVSVNGKPSELTLHKVHLQAADQKPHSAVLVCDNGAASIIFSDGKLMIESAQLAGRKIVSSRDLCNLPGLSLAYNNFI